MKAKHIVAIGALGLIGMGCTSGGKSSSDGSADFEGFMDSLPAEQIAEACMGFQMYNRDLLIDLVDEDTTTFAEWKEENYDPNVHSDFNDNELEEIHNNLTGEQLVSYLERRCNP